MIKVVTKSEPKRLEISKIRRTYEDPESKQTEIERPLELRTTFVTMPDKDKIPLTKIVRVKEIKVVEEAIKGQKTLKEIAKDRTVKTEVRGAAISNIRDSKFLEKLARNRDGMKESVRLREHAAFYMMFALKYIDNDKEKIKDIAINKDEDLILRCAAARFLDDQDIIADLARNDRNKPVREAAIGRITNLEVLMELANKYRDDKSHFGYLSWNVRKRIEELTSLRRKEQPE